MLISKFDEDNQDPKLERTQIKRGLCGEVGAEDATWEHDLLEGDSSR